MIIKMRKNRMHEQRTMQDRNHPTTQREASQRVDDVEKTKATTSEMRGASEAMHTSTRYHAAEENMDNPPPMKRASSKLKSHKNTLQ